MSLIVAFDRKRGELGDCQLLASHRHAPLIVMALELLIALCQPPSGFPSPAYCTSIIQLLATNLNLFASRRLMSETLDLLQRRKRAPGTWPLFSEWILTIEQIHVSSASRLGQYREATLYALKTVYTELGTVLDCAASSMLDDLFALSGCVIVVTDMLSVEAASLLASLMINYAFQQRGLADPRGLAPLIFVLDDALPLIRGSGAGESEGGINPIATWAFMGRSRRMGLVCAAQNYSEVSPALRNNCDTVLCFGSYGQDARELARDLDLTREQASMLSVIRPGEVIAMARSVWPLACRGRVPEVK